MEPSTKRVTLKDVAKIAGVHFSTASRALDPNLHHLVALPLRERIAKIADELGYRPNFVARGLKTRRTRSIGVLVSDITNDVFPPIIKGIETEMMPHGYVVMVANTDGSEKKEAIVVNEFLDRGIDALIVASAYRRQDIISRASREGAVIVALNRAVEDDSISSVLHDDFSGMQKVVSHIFALGHRNIAFISGPTTTWTGKERLDAFMHWSAEYGVTPSPALIIEAKNYSDVEGTSAADVLLARRAGFTAIVTANDDLACGVLASLEKHGLSCPHDISVTGFNDLPIARKIRPALTTVKVDHYRSGIASANILLANLNSANDQRTTQRIRLPTEFIVRDSTKAI